MENYPSFMLIMEDCYVSKFKEDNRNGFKITKDFKNSITLFAPSLVEADEWYSALMRASGITQITDDYEMIELVGKGKFSNVYRSIHKRTKTPVAIKVIEKDKLNEVESSYLNTELAIIKVIDHPLIVELIDVYEDTSKIYIVTEYI